MAALYTLISERDPMARSTNESTTGTPKKKVASKKAARKPKSEVGDPPKKKSGQSRPEPELNINVQIHISSDASADQIDQIFRSMAKHLYGGE